MLRINFLFFQRRSTVLRKRLSEIIRCKMRLLFSFHIGKSFTGTLLIHSSKISKSAFYSLRSAKSDKLIFLVTV